MSRNAKNVLHFRSAPFAPLMFSTVLAGTFGLTSTAAMAACTDSPNSTVCAGAISNAETLEGSGMLFYVQQSEVYEGGDFSLILNDATLADGSVIVTGPKVAAEDSADGDDDVEPLQGTGSITLNGTSSVSTSFDGTDEDTDLGLAVLALENSSITLNGTSSVKVSGAAGTDFAVGVFSPGTANVTTAAGTSITNEALGGLEVYYFNGQVYFQDWQNADGIVAEGQTININIAGTVTAPNGTAIRAEAGNDDIDEDGFVGGNVSVTTSNTVLGKTHLAAEGDDDFFVGGIIAGTNGGNNKIEATGPVTGFIAIGGRTADGDINIKTGAGNISGTVIGVGAQALQGGDITIETGEGVVSALESESHDTGFGIVARSGDDRESETATGGNINITTKGDVIGARTGIGAWTKDGDVTVTTADGKAVGSAGFGDEYSIIADGIKVESGHNGYTDAGQWLEGGGGAVTVNANGIVGGTKSGINAWSREGSVTVNTGAGSQVAGEIRHGIVAYTGYAEFWNEEEVGKTDFRSGGGGDVLVNALGDVGGAEHGVNAWSREGTATVKVGATGKVGGLSNGISVGTGFSDIAGPGDGTGQRFFGGGGTSTVEVAGGGAVKGTEHGISAWTLDGEVIVKTGAGSMVVGDQGAGISAETGIDPYTGGGFIGGGDITIYADGRVGGGWVGINASTSAGDISITTGEKSEVVSAGSGMMVVTGRHDQSVSGGDITIVANGTVTGNGFYGIYADAISGPDMASNATVNVAGDVTGEFAAVHVSAGGNATTIVGVSGTVENVNFGKGIEVFSSEGTASAEVDGKVSGVDGGIFVQTWNGAATVRTGAGSEVSAERFAGIEAFGGQQFLGSGSGDITVVADGRVSGGTAGILAGNNAGNVDITTGADSEVMVGESGIGIAASSNGSTVETGGNVAVTANGKVTGGYFGISAGTNFGNLEITTGASSTVSGSSNYGVTANSTQGDVKADVAGEVQSGGTGVYIQSYQFGDASVSVADTGRVEGETGTGVTVVAANGDASAQVDGNVSGSSIGVSASTFSGDASVVIGAGSQIVSSAPQGVGIFARVGGFFAGSTGGDVSVVADGKVMAQGQGIAAVTLQGNVEVITGASSEVITGASSFVDGDSANGISAITGSGNSRVSVAGKVRGWAQGVVAFSQTEGDASAIVAASGSVQSENDHAVSVSAGNGNASASIDGKVNGGMSGVLVETASGHASIEVGAAAEVIGSTQYGAVAATASGSAKATIDGKVTGEYFGILVSSGTDGDAEANVAATASIKGNQGVGLAAVTRGGDALVENAGRVSGGEAGVFLDAINKRDLTNLASGYILNTSGAFDGRAIGVDASGENVIASNLLNQGRIDGRIYASVFGNITNEGTWNTLGYSSAENGALVNSGTIRAAHAGDNLAESTQLDSYSFANSGLISLIDSLVGSGNKDNDELVIAGNYAGGGSIGLNAYLDSSATSSADTVYFGGDVTGSTVLRVVNTNANGGALIDEANGDGIILAIVAGDVQANAFALEGDVISTGLFDYYLLKDTVSGEDGEMASFELFSRPNNGSAAEAPVVSAAVESVVQSGINPWLDRQLDLRSSVAGGPTITAAADTGPSETSHMGTFWMEGIGGRVDHSGTSRFNNVNVDVGFKQSLYGLTGGADFGRRLSSGGTMLFGMFGSYVTSDIKFAARTNGMKMDGYSVGGYATLMQSNFFASAMVKGDFLDLSHSVGAASGSTDVTSFAFRGDAGYTHKMGNLSLEPLATLVVQNTSIDGYSVGLATFAGSDSEQLAIAGGLRGTVKMDGAAFTLTGRVWKDLSDDNQVDVSFGSAPSSSAVSSGVFGGVYSEIAASGAFSLTDQVSVYGGGTVKFDSDTTAKSAFGGVNFSW
jgi:autotransporter family porin